ncbi:death domain-associated protein 6 isoform X2 [Pseudophryne corroboree]|uniref:death domain-associated protein 6 isoform X2 n=1 Tax=Pseudophryne corroboree TaxID=495146 RepID=UPI00308185E2
MAHAGEIIVLDDDDDDEEPLQCPEAKKSPCKAPPRQSNGKKESANDMSAENKRLFEEFVDYCSKLTSEHPEVISFLQGRHAKANPVYLSSVAFRNTLGSCLTRVQNKRSKIFVYINELCTVLKANSQKRKVSLHSPALRNPAAEVADVANDEEKETEEAPEIKKGSKRQIRYLENLLRIYSLEIKKLQEKELSLEDLEDEDSSYIQESRLKRKLLRIFEKLCELRDCPSLTGRVIEQRIQYRGTRYPEVNRRLEKFINSYRDIFPDYGDVLRVIQKANEKHNLTLSRKQMQSMAQDAFRELGNKLQDRRHLDMVYNFGSHLTDSFKNVNDPALQDQSLARHLRDNRNMALSHLDDIIKKYAEMQDDGEEEERKKWKRESEMPSTSKDEKGAYSSRRSSSPASDEEEEEESDDSDTDIEEELKQCEQIEDGEDGEEEESPGDQENDADPNMDTASDPQVISGGEEDGEKGEEDGDEDLIEEAEEATGQESSPASTSLSNDKESINTSLESEEDVRPSDTIGLQCNDTTTSAKIEDENTREEEDGANQNMTSGETSLEDHTEVEDENSDVKGKDEKEDAEVPLECEPPIGQIEGSGKSADGKNNLLPDIKDSLAEQNEGDESGEENLSEVADISLGESGDERTVPETEPLSPSESVSKDCSTSEYTDEPCEQSRTRIDTEVRSIEESTTTEMEQDCVDTSVKNQSPSGGDVGRCALDVDSGEVNTDCDMSPLGNSKGVDAATEMENSSVPRLKRDKSKIFLKDSIKHRKIKEESTPSRKRKKIPSPTRTENGIVKYNGSDQGDVHLKRKCMKAKTDCSSHTSLSSSTDADSDNDITLDLVVTCSPTNSPPRSSEQCTKSHASTQCDPDEVIVLSD